MNRHLLIALSDDPRAVHGVRFVSSFLSQDSDLNLTLFTAFPKGPQIWEEEKSYETLTEADNRTLDYERQFRKALEVARAMLTAGGFDKKRIEIKCVPQSATRVEDILREGERGLYDAVVLGKRGLARLEQFVEESVTEEALRRNTSVPLWICRNPDEDRSGVLLCLDGSESSLRMADHVGFILSKEERHNVTMLHVNDSGDAAGEIFEKAGKVLADNGVAPQRITSRVVPGKRAARAILRASEQGAHAVVAVGRTGSGKGLLERLFMGSVSRELLQEMRASALWLCR